MRQELVCKIKNNNYKKDKYHFKKDKKLININDVDTKKIVLSNKRPYGKQGGNKYYIVYLNGGFKPLRIDIKNTEFHTNNMNVLANNNELLKYIEIWNKSLYSMKLHTTELHSIKRGFIVNLYIM